MANFATSKGGTGYQPVSFGYQPDETRRAWNNSKV